MTNAQASPARRQMDFDTAVRIGLMVTVAVGVLAAYAPTIPAAVRSPVLVAGLFAWTVGALGCAALGAAAAWRRIRSGDGRAWCLLAAVGIGVAALAAIQTELIHTLGGRPGFTWNWRWDLNLAQAIARTGGLTHALDYAGSPIEYHVGPAWFAAAVQRVFGSGLSHVLFGLAPLLCVLSLVIATLAAFRAGGVRYRYGALAIAVALTAPVPNRSALGFYYAIPEEVLIPQSWPFLGTKMMLNSMLGMAVGLTALALLLDRRTGRGGLVVGAIALASLTHIKPQLYVGFGVMVGLIGLGRALGAGPFAPRDWRLLLAAFLSLAIAIGQLALLPGDDASTLALPEWQGFASGRFREPLHNTTYLLIAGLLTWAFVARRADARSGNSAAEILLSAGTALLGLAGFLHLFRVPFAAGYIDRWLAVGLPVIRPGMNTFEQLGQSVEAPRLLLLAAGFGLLAVGAAHLGGRWRRAFLTIAALIVVSPAGLLVSGFVRPTSEHAVAEDMDLLHALGQIPQEGALLVASDLADQGQNYYRGLQNMLLTAYGGHAFYVSNLRSLHFSKPDALARLEELRSFFGAPWSEWHAAWLAQRGITHVLANDRCRPAWLGAPGVPLRPLTDGGRWIAFAVDLPALRPVMPERPRSDGLHPDYGYADCLSGRWVRDPGSAWLLSSGLVPAP